MAYLTASIQLIRPEQWVKNLLVAVPLALTPMALTATNLLLVLQLFLAFCFLASALYVVNDWVDRKRDRQHPQKRLRPLAAGTVPRPLAAVLMLGLLCAAMALVWPLTHEVYYWFATYLLLNTAYSAQLKHIPVIDIMAIAASFIIRLQAGIALFDITASPWIYVLTGLLALFIAAAKRRDDLVIAMDGAHRKSLVGYSKSFLDLIIHICLSALVIAYIIYTTDAAAIARANNHPLIITVPFVLYGVLRYLQLTVVLEKSGAPVRLLYRDLPLQLTCIGWLATFLALLYLPPSS
jgi:decaprenyl-phosphate phosphoribosyltransferase